MQMKDKRHPYYALRIIMCQSNSPKLPMAVDTAVGWQLSVVIATSPVCPAPSRCVSLSRHNSQAHIMPWFFLRNASSTHPAGMLEPEEAR